MDNYIYKSPIGLLNICEEGGKITSLYLQGTGLDGMLPGKSGRHSDLLYEAYRQLDEYFAGKRKKFDLPVSFTGTEFQKRVWGELQKIPYGETRSYQDIAVRIGNKKAVRAVGQANHKNPILILVPCHRVIHKNGDITGFGCGIEVKRYLLELEKRNM